MEKKLLKQLFNEQINPAFNTDPLFTFSSINNDRVNIKSRRYLGAKTKLLYFIYHAIKDKLNDIDTFADIFGGTGVVSYMFQQLNKKIIINDILESNFVCYNAWFGNQKVDINKIKLLLDELNNLNPIYPNYVSENFGNKYFSEYNAMKIGLIREKIDTYKVNKREKDILLTSLLYAMDKIANTTGHYDAYIKRNIIDKHLFLQLPDLSANNNGNKIFCEDANQLIRHIKADLVYIDTPYNSRQYSSAYHLVENIITWKKPEVEGVASKMVNRKDKNSLYCSKNAFNAFTDLIENVHAKYILVSFSNMENKGNARSNNKITHNQIIDTLKLKGKVTVFESVHNPYTTGKSKINNHREILYLCVTKK